MLSKPLNLLTLFGYTLSYWIVLLTETATGTNKSGDNHQNAEPKKVFTESTLSRNFRQGAGRSTLKETQDSAENDQGLISFDVEETRDSVTRDNTKTPKGGKEVQFEIQSTLEPPNVTRQDKDDLLEEEPLGSKHN